MLIFNIPISNIQKYYAIITKSISRKESIMKNRLFPLIAFLVVLSMLAGVFASCKKESQGSTTTGTDDIQSNTEETADVTEEESKVSESENISEKESENASEEDSDESSGIESAPNDVTEPNEETSPDLEISNGDIIEYAASIANGVQFQFADASRSELLFENSEMSLKYALSNNKAQLVTNLANKNGNSYINNTMDVFVTMKNGSTFYSSNSYISTSANAFRFGYYFYEIRLQDQQFESDLGIKGAKKVSHLTWNRANQCQPVAENGILKITNDDNATDAFVVFGQNYKYEAAKYQLLKITMKADNKASVGQLFIIAGDNKSYTGENGYSFSLNNDGEYHDYYIPLTAFPDYYGTLSGIRLDIIGLGATTEISSMELLEANKNGAPSDLTLSRSFLTYTDKMHHVIQVAAKNTTTDIACVGMETKIEASTVAKIVVGDKNGTHYSLEGIDWDSAEYVGFDIIDAGIFGYILPCDGSGGKIEVTLTDGIYTVIQTHVPTNNTIEPSETNTNNANDFYMGQRIYTDSNHSFDEFLLEAYCERNPLSEKYVKINSGSAGAEFAGYDALRGIYVFNLARVSGGFNTPYYKTPNKHYNIDFTIRGDKYNRKIYAMTSVASGQLECAVLLDQDNLLLPIPIQVGKNFSEAAGDRCIFNLDDTPYSEAIFPLVIGASEKVTYNILNLYQRWGNFPLKQLSWIQFQSPYYHLSTGVTETNCILPWSYTPWSYTSNFKGLNTLPDFRPMSAPLWESQPQHTSCGTHTWLVYTDADGNHVTYECTNNLITSYGPVYAEVVMDYISDDGKIRSTYTHMELPQTDENRTYYTMTYEVLEDVSFKDFSRDFEFYRVTDNDPTGIYQQLGYLNENNECVVTDAIVDKTIINADGSETKQIAEPVEYVLGDNCPYFSLFKMEGGTKDNGYSNLAFLIYNSSFVIGGQEVKPRFSIVHSQNNVAISLDYDELTLKEGDKFTINCVLLPWGSQETIYDGSNGLAPDQSVRNVREDTLLDPIKATPFGDKKDCETRESVFIPMVKSIDGKTATFTVSGGSRTNDPVMEDGRNNIVIRAYGFDMLTAPYIEELIDGVWKEYSVNSYNTPDQAGYAHSYDGYSVYYDNNGTFSYAFVIDMTDGKDRTFRMSVDKEFQGWPEEPTVDAPPALESYIHPESNYTLSDLYYVSNLDGINGISIGRRTANFTSTEVITFHYNSRTVMPGTVTNNLLYSGTHLIASGWAVVEGGASKYVWSVDGGKTWNDAELCGRALSPASSAMVDKAHEITNNQHTFSATNDIANGSFQGMNANNARGICADLSDYVGQTVNLIFAIVPAANENTLCPIVYVTGIKVVAEEEVEEKPLYNEYVKEGSGYTVSKNNYASCIDIISGKQFTGTVRYSDTGNNGVTTMVYNGTTKSKDSTSVDGTYLQFSGWTVVESGVSKLVFSTDGGMTWTDIPDGGMIDVNSNLIDNGANKRGVNYVFTTANDITGGNFQGGKLFLDLSASAGSTVDVILAAVPINSPDSLCILANITGVTVPASK